MAHGPRPPTHSGARCGHLSRLPPMCFAVGSMQEKKKKKVILHNHSTAVTSGTLTVTDDSSLMSRLLSSPTSCSSHIPRSEMAHPPSRAVSRCPASFRLLRSGTISSSLLDFHGLNAFEDGLWGTGRRGPRFRLVWRLLTTTFG